MLVNILKAILSIFITPPVADAGDYRRSKKAVAVMVIIAVSLFGMVFYSLITHNPMYAAIYLTALYWLPCTVGNFIYTHDMFRKLKDPEFCIEFLAKEGCITYSLMKKFCDEYPTKFFWGDKALWTSIILFLDKSCNFRHNPEKAIKYENISKSNMTA